MLTFTVLTSCPFAAPQGSGSYATFRFIIPICTDFSIPYPLFPLLDLSFQIFSINCSFLVLLTTQFIQFQWIISGRIGQISDFSLPPLPLVFGCGILGAFQRYCQRRKEHFVL